MRSEAECRSYKPFLRISELFSFSYLSAEIWFQSYKRVYLPLINIDFGLLSPPAWWWLANLLTLNSSSQSLTSIVCSGRSSSYKPRWGSRSSAWRTTIAPKRPSVRWRPECACQKCVPALAAINLKKYQSKTLWL